jgi:hypothetical membrane protein
LARIFLRVLVQVWPMTTPVHYWASIWMYKELIITIGMAISGVCMAFYVAQHVIRRRNYNARDAATFCLVVCFFALM